jgi:hypothetical protein
MLRNAVDASVAHHRAQLVLLLAHAALLSVGQNGIQQHDSTEPGEDLCRWMTTVPSG